MESVQRVALIVRPTQQYVDWVNNLHQPGPRLTMAEARAHPSIYLVNTVPEHALEDDRYATEIFESELEAWTTDETMWPADRSVRAFHDWFEVALADQIWDLDEQDAMFYDEVAGECGWCGRPLGDGDSVVTITLVRAPGGPQFPPGPLSLPAAGRTISATVPVRDSESGRQGAGALILLCGQECASKVRSALRLRRDSLRTQ